MSIELDASQGERDVYGRLLAYVWLPDGRNFGEVMIADGFAHEYTYNLPYAYVESFKAAQDAAIANQVGLWSPATCAGDTEKPTDNIVETAPAAVAPTPDPATPAPQTAFDPSKYVGQGNRYNCRDFKSQANAQARS